MFGPEAEAARRRSKETQNAGKNKNEPSTPDTVKNKPPGTQQGTARTR